MQRKVLGGVISLVLLGLLIPLVAHAQSLDKLAKGKIFVRAYKVKGSDAPKVVMTAMVNRPPDKVWEVLKDCSTFRKKFDRVIQSKLLKKEQPHIHHCKIVVDMPFPFSDLTSVTRVTHTVTPGQWKRHWTLISGDYKSITGSWVLKPFNKEGTKTWVRYTIHAEPNVAIPAWIRNQAQQSNLPNMMKRLRKEANKIK